MQSGYSELVKKKQTGKLLTNYETKTKILKNLSLSPTKSIALNMDILTTMSFDTHHVVNFRQMCVVGIYRGVNYE